MTGIDIQRAYTFAPVADSNGVIQATLIMDGLTTQLQSTAGALAANVDKADPSSVLMSDLSTHLWCLSATATNFDNPDTNGLFIIAGVDGSCAKDMTSPFDLQLIAHSQNSGATQWFEFNRSVASGPVTKTAGPAYTKQLAGPLSNGHALGIGGLMQVDGTGNITKLRDYNICQNGKKYTGPVAPSTALLW